MKTIYSFIQQVVNGTSVLKTITNNFSTKELAEETLASVKEAAKHGEFPSIFSKVYEDVVYESAEEIPFNKIPNEKVESN